MPDREVIFTGARKHPEPRLVHRELDAEQRLAWEGGGQLFVAVGDCRTGVDREVLWWCRQNLRRAQFAVYVANWKQQGKEADPIRNRAMIAAHPGAAQCVALPLRGPRKLSRGAWDCHDAAVAAGIPVRVVYPGAGGDG